MTIKKDVAITPINDPYIQRLEEEKEILEKRIKEIQIEIRTINNLIYRKKSENFAGRTGENINLKNADRLFFEAIIIDALKTSKRGLRTKEIYDTLIKLGYGMNYNTLRSYVTKMRDKSLIKRAPLSSYNWILNSDDH